MRRSVVTNNHRLGRAAEIVDYVGQESKGFTAEPSAMATAAVAIQARVVRARARADNYDVGSAVTALPWQDQPQADGRRRRRDRSLKGKWLGGTGKFEGLSGEFEIRPASVLVSDTLVQGAGKKTGTYQIKKTPVAQK